MNVDSAKIISDSQEDLKKGRVLRTSKKGAREENENRVNMKKTSKRGPLQRRKESSSLNILGELSQKGKPDDVL